MPVKKNVLKSKKKVSKKVVEVEEEENEGMSLDDAFGDDEDVEYGKPKEKKAKKGLSEEEIEEDLEEAGLDFIRVWNENEDR